jgi:hypothetical protein
MRVFAISLVVALMLAGTAMGEISIDGLVGEWHFDEGSGNIAKDSSGNNNDGIIHGAEFDDGKFGKALSFDGVDDYVERSYDPDFTPGNDSWTIALWVKAPRRNSDYFLV